MGTDIHVIFQAKKNGKWHDIPHHYKRNRNYLLFAWLGGVRNGYGFAGVSTHTPLRPLAQERGYPEDFEVVDEVYHPIPSTKVLAEWDKKWYDEHGWEEDDRKMTNWMGDHSHSWVTADEVIDAPDQGIVEYGVVTREFYEQWDHKTPPESYSGGIMGKDIYVQDAINVTGLGIQLKSNTTHVRISWKNSVKEDCQYFVDEMIRLKKKHGEVRMVFGFDS